MSKLIDGYFEYIESYLYSFNELAKNKNNEIYFFTLGFIYVNFMELWIKETIMCFDGFPENYTIEGFGIGNHDFESLLMAEDTINEFNSLGINNKEIEGLTKDIHGIKEKIGINNLSLAFRYPCDKNNNIYIQKLNNKKKKEIIILMQESINHSLQVFLKHVSGVGTSLLNQAQIMQQKLERLTKKV